MSKNTEKPKRPVHGGQGPREDRGMSPTNQGPRPVTPPPKPSDVGPKK